MLSEVLTLQRGQVVSQSNPTQKDSSTYRFRNRVIHSLRPQAQEFIGKRVDTRPISQGETLYNEGDVLTHAIFPHEGVISFMGKMEDGRSVEKASVGVEGFLGFGVVMGGETSMSASVVQVPGYASWLPLSDLAEALEEFVCVRQTMLRYAKALITQTMESVACNSLHSAEQRVSRWLLHAYDRISGDTLLVTQQAISEVLGLRRATVSAICSSLQDSGILDYSRGAMQLANLDGLEARACECYGRISQAALRTE
jgi:CRP-like cAMP-binding protein